MKDEELKKISYDVLCIKHAMMKDDNTGILLFLAKYNPDITKDEIIEKFGTGATEGLKELINCNLVKEEDNKIFLTEEGIFQMAGLLAVEV